MLKRQHIDITGTVQGIGFRPAVYRIAARLGLAGFTYNDTKGVSIEIQGEEKQIKEFLHALKSGPEQPEDAAVVEMNTKIGGRRIEPMPYGRELPRIC